MITMTNVQGRNVFVAAIIFAALISYGARTEALSHQWSSALPNLCAVGSNSCPKGTGWFSMFNVQASVMYNAQVVNTQTGEVIACGSEVPSGTKVQYKFVPHTYSDIAWFATGRGFDSPYGDWVAGGAAPPGEKCLDKNSIGRTGGGGGYGTAFGSLAIEPPAKTVSGLPGTCTTAADGASQDCTLSQVGNVPAVFNFASTFGYMHSALRPEGGGSLEAKYKNQCLGWNIMGTNKSAPYRVSIPSHSMACPIAVVTSNETPSAPTLSVQNNAACVVGTAHTLTMTATDPKGGALRYGVDWDNNSTIDEFVPASGYVPSGTQLTASRTYAVAGEKKVRVLAQNNAGFTSGWTTITFTCSIPGDDTGADVSSVVVSETVSEGSGIDINGFAAPANLSLRAIPSLVRSGDTTKVNWSATNVQSCTVRAPNGDSWDTVLSALGGETTRPITQQTTYTLSCIDLDDGIKTRTVTVQIVPVFTEQ